MTIEEIIKEIKEISRGLVSGTIAQKVAGGRLLYLMEKLEVQQANCFAELRSVAQGQWLNR